MARGFLWFSGFLSGDTRVTETSRPVELSISQLAREFDCTRETVRQKLSRAGFAPVPSHLQPVSQAQTDAFISGPIDDKTATVMRYRLRDAIKAFMADPAGNDTNRMLPLQRKQFYQAQREQMELQVRMGNLLSRIEVEDEFARNVKIVALALDTLPDILERDCNLRGEVLTKIEEILDRAREAMYLALCKPDALSEPPNTNGAGT
jgi:hypothetical protein